jgi:hypothetical protein
VVGQLIHINSQGYSPFGELQRVIKQKQQIFPSMTSTPTPSKGAPSSRQSIASSVGDPHGLDSLPLQLPLPPSAPASVANSNRSSWFSTASMRPKPVKHEAPKPVAPTWITDGEVYAMPHIQGHVVVTTPGPTDLASRLYREGLLSLENHFKKYLSVRYYMANECMFLADEEYDTLNALVKSQRDHPGSGLSLVWPCTNVSDV